MTATEGDADRDELVAALRDVVGAPHCLTDPELTAGYTVDWTGRYGGPAAAVVRPADATEVAAVLAVAAAYGMGVIPQGGNTGLVGGSVPRPGTAPQIVLSTRRLSTIRRCDAAEALLDADAGVTLQSAQEAAAAVGRHLGIDLAARGSATLGGLVATNAGGVHVVRYGSMRTRLAGLEAVLVDGTVVSRMSGLRKDNVGWDPSALFAGSEGTLAIVTRVLLHLEREPRHRIAALVALPDAGAAVSLVLDRLLPLGSLESVELTLRDGMDLVVEHAGLPDPIGRRATTATTATAWLTVEAAADADPSDDLAAALDDERVLEVAVASDALARQRLWAYREAHTEAISSLGVPHKMDVSVRPGLLSDLLEALPGCVAAAAPGARLVVFGHVGDGNLHVNVIGPSDDDEAIDDAVYQLVLSLGGSVSAEHGVGVAKTRFLPASRSAGTLEAMRRIKQALDPGGILNPGVLEPPDRPAGL